MTSSQQPSERPQTDETNNLSFFVREPANGGITLQQHQQQTLARGLKAPRFRSASAPVSSCSVFTTGKENMEMPNPLLGNAKPANEVGSDTTSCRRDRDRSNITNPRVLYLPNPNPKMSTTVEQRYPHGHDQVPDLLETSSSSAENQLFSSNSNTTKRTASMSSSSLGSIAQNSSSGGDSPLQRTSSPITTVLKEPKAEVTPIHSNASSPEVGLRSKALFVERSDDFVHKEEKEPEYMDDYYSDFEDEQSCDDYDDVVVPKQIESCSYHASNSPSRGQFNSLGSYYSRPSSAYQFQHNRSHNGTVSWSRRRARNYGMYQQQRNAVPCPSYHYEQQCLYRSQREGGPAHFGMPNPHSDHYNGTFGHHVRGSSRSSSSSSPSYDGVALDQHRGGRSTPSKDFLRRSTGQVTPFTPASNSPYISSCDDAPLLVTPVVMSPLRSTSGGSSGRRKYYRKISGGNSVSRHHYRGYNYRSSPPTNYQPPLPPNNGSSSSSPVYKWAVKWIVSKGSGLILWILLIMVGLCSIGLTIITNKAYRLAQQQQLQHQNAMAVTPVAGAEGYPPIQEYSVWDLKPSSTTGAGLRGPLLQGLGRAFIPSRAWPSKQTNVAVQKQPKPTSRSNNDPSTKKNHKSSTHGDKTKHMSIHEGGVFQPHAPLPSVAIKSEKVPVAIPTKKLTKPHSFEKQDRNLYRASTLHTGKKKAHKHDAVLSSGSLLDTSKKRTVVLHESMIHAKLKPRKVQLYPPDFTDNTQLYGILDSDDERIKYTMELREPLVQGECVPMQEWQTTFHPSCNSMHEVDLSHLGERSVGMDFKLFGTKGYWRNAWKVESVGDEERNHHDKVVLKTLKIEHRFEEAHFEHDRIDAVAMERLTKSPHVINIFGFCGHSVVTEYGEPLRDLVKASEKTSLARLRIARDIASGLADVHGIDGDGNATFVHLDVNPANVVSVSGRLVLNDFNIGILRRWNTTSKTPCGFPAQYPNPQWRSPEEARNEQNLTEKVDVFSMGHIFFKLICGHEPWNKLESGGKLPKEEMNEKVKKGILPTIPVEVLQSKDPEIVAIREAMLKCYTYEPTIRPSAREIVKYLQEALERLDKPNKSSAKINSQRR